jgi:hypothetical protein
MYIKEALVRETSFIMFLYLLIRDLGDFGTIDDRLTNAAECKGQGWLSNVQWASQLSVAQEVNLKMAEDNCFKSLIKRQYSYCNKQEALDSRNGKENKQNLKTQRTPRHKFR